MAGEKSPFHGFSVGRLDQLTRTHPILPRIFSPTDETPTEPSPTSEAQRFFEGQGFTIARLRGISLAELEEYGIDFWTSIPTGPLSEVKSITSLVAVRRNWSLPGTFGVPVDTKRSEVLKYERSLQERFPDVRVVEGGLPEHAQLTLLIGDYVGGGEASTITPVDGVDPRGDVITFRSFRVNTQFPRPGLVLRQMPYEGDNTASVYPLILLAS
jgi:hypothetical protein